MKLIATTLLMPPGIFLVFALLAWIYFKAKPALAHTFLVIAIIIGWTFSTEAFGRYLSSEVIKLIYSNHENVDLEKTDMIVVLTSGMNHTGDLGWMPTSDSYRRGVVAFELQNRVGSRVPLLISGGKKEGLDNPSEAEVLLNQFDRHRAQITPTILEEKSTSTYENALQSAAIIQHHNADQVFLVTSEIHMPRALAVFRNMGVDPVPLPVFTIDRRTAKFGAYLPSAEGLEMTADALYEILGMVSYVMNDHARIEDILRK